MKITTKHRIAYKFKSAPGEPVEMAIWRREEGDYVTPTGDLVAGKDGEPVYWVREMIDENSDFVGHIIEPPFEPYVGMVVENPDDADGDYYVCYCVNAEESAWISSAGVPYVKRHVERLLKDHGWRVRNDPAS